jgi:hypothetical protein
MAQKARAAKDYPIGGPHTYTTAWKKTYPNSMIASPDLRTTLQDRKATKVAAPAATGQQCDILTNTILPVHAIYVICATEVHFTERSMAAEDMIPWEIYHQQLHTIEPTVQWFPSRILHYVNTTLWEDVEQKIHQQLKKILMIPYDLSEETVLTYVKTNYTWGDDNVTDQGKRTYQNCPVPLEVLQTLPGLLQPSLMGDLRTLILNVRTRGIPALEAMILKRNINRFNGELIHAPLSFSLCPTSIMMDPHLKGRGLFVPPPELFLDFPSKETSPHPIKRNKAKPSLSRKKKKQAKLIAAVTATQAIQANEDMDIKPLVWSPPVPGTPYTTSTPVGFPPMDPPMRYAYTRQTNQNQNSLRPAALMTMVPPMEQVPALPLPVPVPLPLLPLAMINPPPSLLDASGHLAGQPDIHDETRWINPQAQQTITQVEHA